ncbi:hypothetical protein F5B18DRAFT_668482 [Nemania serpens]|nr:hypothetical protein F5B18DRAFT_668482 [Nemania serpens]
MTPIHTPDENPAWRDIIVNAVFNTLAVVVIGLRLYSRRLTRAGFGWDDGFIVLSSLLVNAMLIVTGFLISLGFGLPQREVPHETASKIMELGRTFRLLFLFCICTVKLSALFFYLRVFANRTLQANTLSHGNTANTESKTPVSTFPFPRMRSYWRSFWEIVRRPSIRLVSIVLIYVVIAWSVINVIRELTICGITKHICAGHRVTDLETCVFNSAGDLLIFILPLWPIWRLQMSRNAKIGLSIVLMLGTLTILVAFLRFEAIVHTDYAGDYNRTAMKSINYAILELNLAILCISLPMLQPLLRKARGHGQGHVPIGSVRRTTEWAGTRRWDHNTSYGPSSSISGGKSSTVGSSPRSGCANIELPAAVLARAGTDDEVATDRNRNGSRDKSRDENLIAKVKRVWSMESRGSSQDDIVEMASPPADISVTRDSETGSFRREDWPFTPFTGVTITTITAGRH